jgi:hypothetical protein
VTSPSLNRALITNTALLDASAILDGKSLYGLSSGQEMEYYVSRICSFLALCEAICLLDNAYVLATPNRGCSNFISTLRAAEVVSDFTPNYNRDELRQYYRTMPLDVRTFLGSKVYGSFWKNYYASFPNLPADWTPSHLPKHETSADPLHLWHTLILAPQKMSGPDVRPRDHILRGIAYVIISSIERMDYFPDAYRSPYVQAFLGTLYRSLSVTLYERVASALEDSISIGDEHIWPLSIDLPIPPVGALVLGRAKSTKDIPEALLEVRSEFAQYRRYFSDFKEALRTAESFKDRRRLVNRYRRLLAMAAGEKSESVTATEVLEVGGAALKAALAPASPVSYSGVLMSLPIDRLKNWWQKRPLSIVYRLDSKLPQIEEYNGLVGKHWGDSVANGFHAHAIRRVELTRRLLDQSRSNERITARQLRQLQW